MSRIHPTAWVDPKAELDSTVVIGPFAVIGPHVHIGARTQVGPHAVIEGHTTLGQDNQIFQFCSIGAIPQDKKYAGEPTRLEIGDRNTIREFCTFNVGVVGAGGVTRVGDDNWVMAYVHVAHDCRIGSHTTIANATQFGGHVEVGDWVTIGGLTGVHQFVRIGAHAMTGFQTRLAQDVPPFITVSGNPAQAQGINQEGLRRRGYGSERIALIKQMYRMLYRQGNTLEHAKNLMVALRGVSSELDGDVDTMLDFLQGAARGIVR